MTLRPHQTIVIAGAAGYIGQALIKKILNSHDRSYPLRIIALSRSKRHSEDPRLEWKECDLFSLKSFESAISGYPIDLALYLVHSMGPTAHLDQGSFADYDLIMADNFARGLEKNHQHQSIPIIYLGGIVPNQDKPLSTHLSSRLEMEQVFKDYQLAYTFFRAGLIIGKGGSSFQMMLNLLKSIPILPCPKWTKTLTSPSYLPEVINCLYRVIIAPEKYQYQIYDLAGCPAISYLELLKETSKLYGLKRIFIPVPFNGTLFSKWILPTITQTPKELVAPLIDSLAYPMVATAERAFPGAHLYPNFKSLLAAFKSQLPITVTPKAIRTTHPIHYQDHTVRSVQRLPLPSGWNAQQVKEEYLRWLPQFFRAVIRIQQRGDIKHEIVQFQLSFFGIKMIKLLELTFNHERSDHDRQLLYITGGLLARSKPSGRLEFRTVLQHQYILAAIHNFQPSLPWYLYIVTQAPLHLLVMICFRRHLLFVSRGQAH